MHDLPLDLPETPEGWVWRRLDDLVAHGRSICYGVVQPGPENSDGIPLIRVKDIQDGNISTQGLKRISAEVHAGYQRSVLEGNEILLSLVGTLGCVVKSNENHIGYNVARAVGVLPIDSHEISFVTQCLRTPFVQQYMYRWANTTVQATLNLGDVNRLPIPFPPKTERRRIAYVLGTLDDKIELNRQMNATLEAIAQAIFKSWFVDFDGHDDFVESDELGLIPRGWEIKSLSDCGKFLNGVAIKKYMNLDPDEETLPAIKIREMRSGFDDKSAQVSLKVPDKYLIENGDILFSWSGSLLVTIWTGGRGVLNQHIFKVSSKQYPRWFMYLWTREHLGRFQRIAASKATTMGHIKRGHLKEAKVLIPPKEHIDEMSATFEPLLEKYVLNQLQSRTLTELRDTLLPKLISGELRVPEALEIAGEVVEESSDSGDAPQLSLL